MHPQIKNVKNGQILRYVWMHLHAPTNKSDEKWINFFKIRLDASTCTHKSKMMKNRCFLLKIFECIYMHPQLKNDEQQMLSIARLPYNLQASLVY